MASKISNRKIVGIVLAVVGLVGLSVLIPIGIAVEWRLQLAREVNGKLAELRAAGLPTNGKELNAYYPAVPDNENAALVLTQAFDLIHTFPDTRSNEVTKFKLPARKQPLTTNQKQLLDEYVTMNRDALARASNAFGLSQSRYPVDFSAGVETLLPHLRDLKKLAQISADRAILAAESGDTATATTAATDILQLARTLDPEPCLVSQLVRESCIATATTTLERTVNQSSLTESELRRLNLVFVDAQKTNLMARGLMGERAMYLPYFRMSWADIRHNVNLGEENREHQSISPNSPKQPAILRATGFFERDLLFYLQVMETNIAYAQLPPPDSLPAAKVFENAAVAGRQHYYILSGLFLPALSKTVIREAESFAHLRLAITAIAVERFHLVHQNFPERLDQLVPEFLSAVPADPFDGAPLRYQSRTNGYTIYSIGSDGHDNHGREKPFNWKFSDHSEYDLTFIVER